MLVGGQEDPAQVFRRGGRPALQLGVTLIVKTVLGTRGGNNWCCPVLFRLDAPHRRSCYKSAFETGQSTRLS